MTQYPPKPRPPYKQSQPEAHSQYGDFQVNHFLSYNYVLENPNWLLNVLYVGIALFIPLVGVIAVYGYMSEVVWDLHRSRGTRYSDFSVEKVGDYLSRGIWPALVVLIASVVLVPILWILIIGWVAITGMFGGPLVLVISIPFLLLVLMCIWVPVSLFLIPLGLRAAFSKKLWLCNGFEFCNAVCRQCLAALSSLLCSCIRRIDCWNCCRARTCLCRSLPDDGLHFLCPRSCSLAVL